MGTQKDKLQKGTTGQPKDWQASTRRFRVLGGFFSSAIFLLAQGLGLCGFRADKLIRTSFLHVR